MIKGLIQKQVEKITLQDIYAFALKNGISLEQAEAELIYRYIKTSWEELIFSDHNRILMEAKPKLRETTFYKIEELITFFKQKYKNYL